MENLLLLYSLECLDWFTHGGRFVICAVLVEIEVEVVVAVAGVVGVGIGKLLQVLKSGEVGPAMALQNFTSESRSWQR